VDVEQGHHYQGSVGGGQLVRGDDVLYGRSQVLLSEGDALGAARGAGCVQEKRFVSLLWFRTRSVLQKQKHGSNQQQANAN